ncbi:MAG: ATP-binding cassette, subfamily bacterial [Gaiellales bacterium]|jgi:ABC-type multidrug transport system fused ATPase/permease subunit|nr:ATP-binding cassette, subfamily bacterial [Gaiellales bacterium]
MIPLTVILVFTRTTELVAAMIIGSIIGCIAGIIAAWCFRRAIARLKSPKKRADTRQLARGADFRRSMILIARFTQGHQRLFIGGFVLLGVEALTSVFAWYPLTYMIDYFDKKQVPLGFPGIETQPWATVVLMCVLLIVLLTLNSAADSLAEICLARGGRTLGFHLRVGLYSHLQRLSLSFHDRSRKGDVMFRVVGDVKEFERFIINSLSDLAGSILLLLVTLAFIGYESWQVLIVALIVLPGTAIISWYFSTRIKATAKRQRAREGDLASATQEMLNSIRVVQMFGRGGRDEERFIDNSSRAMSAALESARLDAWFSWIITVFEAIAMAATILVSVYLVEHNQMSLGTMILVVLLIRQMFKPSKRIIKQWNEIAKVFASVERIADLLDQPVTVHDTPGAVSAPAFNGQVEFRDVTFAYRAEEEEARDEDDRRTPEGERPPALRDVSFSIEPGEVVALAGPSGAGKSTIAQLIPRLYDPDRGAILIDGLDVRGFTLDSLRCQISMVLQDTVLLSGTVADNIAYGLPDATRDEIVAAAVRANADEFIKRLPGGYDCDLTERGANLSGGQRQRIAIARAMIRATPIMILDEPTTGLDAQSADQVLAGLRVLMMGKTTLLVSHDFKLLAAADRVLVLEEGRMAGSGRQRDLVSKGVEDAEQREGVIRGPWQ